MKSKRVVTIEEGNGGFVVTNDTGFVNPFSGAPPVQVVSTIATTPEGALRVVANALGVTLPAPSFPDPLIKTGPLSGICED